MTAPNQHPEQIARDKIDEQLIAAGWCIQDKSSLDPSKGLGIAFKEYQTDVGPADYGLLINRQAVGVIEAKPADHGHKITSVEEQSTGYADAKPKFNANNDPLNFVIEATGEIIRLTDRRDPKPRAREIYNFPRPEMFKEWMSQDQSLRTKLSVMPPLEPRGLRDCQIEAIEGLEKSLAKDKQRALIQMATGAGKTFTAITSVYRLLKHTNLRRVLFLVDTKNLGQQAEQEFRAFVPNDDNRQFTDLYNVRRLSSSSIPKDAQVCISTIQRMYSILKGEELEEEADESNPHESLLKPKTPVPVAYNSEYPPEFFDLIIIDECHRSIFGTWRQVIEYFDAYHVGLTATPDNRAIGFFGKNIVSHYSHEKAVADGVNVAGEIWTIDTKITTGGAVLRQEQQIELRERLTRSKRWELQTEEEAYDNKVLDKSVVNPDQIRTVIREFCNRWPDMFPGRKEVPKTLIFAKTDSHATDIIEMVRSEFGESNEFCKKITYKTDDGDPDSLLARFRNDYHPRIAVTVDMIATGTDVKPLECLVFMRDVRSANYFEQMKGRGTRTYDEEKLKGVTPSAKTGKTHFVIVDAVGVTRSQKTTSKPLIKKPTVPLKDLATGIMMGARDEETVSSLAGRLARLGQQLTDDERDIVKEKSHGHSVEQICGRLVDAIDPDIVEERARQKYTLGATDEVNEAQYENARSELVHEAAQPINMPFIDYLVETQRQKEQKIDHDNIDEVIHSGSSAQAKERATSNIDEFTAYLIEHQDEIEALRIYFKQPQRRSEVTYKMIKALLGKIKLDRPNLMPLAVWDAYRKLDKVKSKDPVSELTALVSLIRTVCKLDAEPTAFEDTVRRNFQTWIMSYHSGGSGKYTKEQMEWLRMIRDHIASSFHIEKDDFDLSPFDAKGGLGKMHQLFGNEMSSLVEELNEALVA
ncbi:DEAD/DEAH box helicase family protein [Alphaproteobacteria bacterium]|nr:DEAD/DEAH box helicase family protein [Alphaproteobacteria bacterium]